MLMYFYNLHKYLIALIKIMLKLIMPHLHAPAPSPLSILVLLFSDDYISQKNMIIWNSILSFVEAEHITIVA